MDDRMIYVIGTIHGPKKVGYAREPQRRLAAIRRSHFTAKILELWPVSNEMAITVESLAHIILTDRRISGEWFRGGLRYIGEAIDTAFLVAEDPDDIDLNEVRLAARRGRTRAGLDRAKAEGRLGGSVARHSNDQIIEFAQRGIIPGARAAKMSVSGFQKALARARKAKEAQRAKRKRKA